MTKHGICVVLLVSVAAACGGNTPTAPTSTLAPSSSQSALPDITGIYVLMTINGNNLPYTPPQEGVNVTSGTFTIKADGTCSSNVAFALPSGPASSQEVSGSYTREGSRLTIQWQAGRTAGTVEGNTFTMDNAGTLYAYRR